MTKSEINYISASDVKKERGGGKKIIIIDGRTAEEFAAGHVPGSINIPIPDLPSKLGAIKEGDPLLVITTCGSTGRGEKAATVLQDCGLEGVMVLECGLKAWREMENSQAPS